MRYNNINFCVILCCLKKKKLWFRSYWFWVFPNTTIQTLSQNRIKNSSEISVKFWSRIFKLITITKKSLQYLKVTCSLNFMSNMDFHLMYVIINTTLELEDQDANWEMGYNRNTEPMKSIQYDFLNKTCAMKHQFTCQLVMGKFFQISTLGKTL